MESELVLSATENITWKWKKKKTVFSCDFIFCFNCNRNKSIKTNRLKKCTNDRKGFKNIFFALKISYLLIK